jgi:serine/threonine protein kinase
MKHSRSLSIPYILDEDEEMLLDDSDKALLKRFATDSFFELKGDVGKGSNNCAYFVHDSDGNRQVLRIALLPDLPMNESVVRHNKKIVRGLEMVHAFQSYKYLLGPSLLKEESKYLLVNASDLQTYVYGQICEEVMDKYQRIKQIQKDDPKFNNQFALQHLEYLEGGEFKNEAQQGNERLFLFSIFSLVWFLCMSQKTFDFRHRDLKASNVIFRRTNTTRRYNFELSDKNLYFHFESPIVPVVIDYDFATTFEAESPDDRYATGTDYAAPPDALIRRITLLMGGFYTLKPHEKSYDWWGLGVCILELVHFGLINFFSKEADWFAKNLQKILGTKNDSVYWSGRGLFFASCLASIFSRSGPFVRPPPEWYLYGREFFPDNTPVVRMDKNAEYKMLKKWFDDLFRKKNWIAVLLNRFLNWDPSVRDNNGDPMEHLLYFEIMAEQQRRPGVFYEFRSTSKPTRIILDGYPLLKSDLCSNCVEKSQFLCTCCKELFCSKECQKKKH